MCWTYDNAEGFGIDISRIGIGGDSAGAALSAGVCLIARERQLPVRIAFMKERFGCGLGK